MWYACMLCQVDINICSTIRRAGQAGETPDHLFLIGPVNVLWHLNFAQLNAVVEQIRPLLIWQSPQVANVNMLLLSFKICRWLPFWQLIKISAASKACSLRPPDKKTLPIWMAILPLYPHGSSSTCLPCESKYFTKKQMLKCPFLMSWFWMREIDYTITRFRHLIPSHWAVQPQSPP